MDIENVSRETYEKLERYHALLVKWQKAINIVSPATMPAAWERHFIDSAQVSKLIPVSAKIYADLGCGGGFPGLVLAMMHPDLQVYLVESDERKGQFMRTVIRETQTKNAHVCTKRVEDAYEDFIPDVVSARALASLDKLLSYCMPWALQNPDLTLLFMKGQKADEEIIQARAQYDFEVESFASVTDSQARILRVSCLKTCCV